MSKLVWDAAGEKLFETGTKEGVLYVVNSSGAYPRGVAWNGLTGVDESPSGAEATKLYADDTVYATLISTEEFGGTVKAYMYPEEFEECDGSAELTDGMLIGQQNRKGFGLAYKTVLGNDTDGNDHGYKIHLVYGAKAKPTSKSFATINDSPNAIEFSWELSTTPVAVTGYKPTATVVIDSTKATAANLKALEDILYGVDAALFDQTKTYAVGDYCNYASGQEAAKLYRCKTAITQAGAWDASKWDEITNPGPRLPLPDEVKTILAAE